MGPPTPRTQVHAVVSHRPTPTTITAATVKGGSPKEVIQRMFQRRCPKEVFSVIVKIKRLGNIYLPTLFVRKIRIVLPISVVQAIN